MRPLITKGELAFYQSLRQAVGARYAIMAQVRLADLLFIPGSTPNYTAHLNRITSKHADFVLCEPSTLRPVMAIELDDASHQRHDRQDRDGFKDRALKAAGLPLLRVRAAASFPSVDLARRVEEVAGKPGPMSAKSST